MTKKIFIDGEHGTTGLLIQKRLAERSDLELLSIAHEDRHNFDLRLDYLRAADIAILCLPDDAAREAVDILKDTCSTRIIDSSTAHRIAPDWVYGFAELTQGQKERIRAGRFVSNPGCYPTGALGLIRPLREAGIIGDKYPISINAVSGYTGGGKQMIAQMEDTTRDDAILANYFVYGLNLHHKHVPEIQTHGKLDKMPIFIPSVGRFPQGMIVNLPLHRDLLNKSVSLLDIQNTLEEHYSNQAVVKVASLNESSQVTRLDPESLANTNQMKLYVFGDEKSGIFNLCAVLDNLGKGASGAAIQNLDIMISGQ